VLPVAAGDEVRMAGGKEYLKKISVKTF